MCDDCIHLRASFSVSICDCHMANDWCHYFPLGYSISAMVDIKWNSHSRNDSVGMGPKSAQFRIHICSYPCTLSFLGNFNGNLTYEDGLLSLTYTGGRLNCHDKYERKTIINFRCDYSTYGTRGPTFVKEGDDCVYIFDWATHWACMPFKVCSSLLYMKKTPIKTTLSFPLIEHY